MKQNTKTKLDICNICLSVPVGLAQPSEAQRERPWGQGQPGGHPTVVLCPGGWPCCCLFLVFCLLVSSFLFLSSGFLHLNSVEGEMVAGSGVSQREDPRAGSSSLRPPRAPTGISSGDTPAGRCPPVCPLPLGPQSCLQSGWDFAERSQLSPATTRPSVPSSRRHSARPGGREGRAWPPPSPVTAVPSELSLGQRARGCVCPFSCV